MDPIELVRTWRRRWRLVAAFMVFGLLFGLASLRSGPQPSPVTYYSATDQVVLKPGASSIQQLATLVTDGEVPKRVADRIGGSPPALAHLIQVTIRPEYDLMEITAFDIDPVRSVELADTFADELIRFESDLVNRQRDSTLAPLTEAYDRQFREYTDLVHDTPGAAQATDVTGFPQLASRRKDLTDLATEMREVQTQALIDSGLTTTHSAEPIAVSGRTLSDLFDARYADPKHTMALPTLDILQEPAPQPLGTPLSRGSLGAAFGLLFGLILTVVIERVDPRVRSRQDAERSFGWPVVAEIPMLHRRQRQAASIVALDHPRSRAAEAYRRLRSSLLDQPVADGGRVIMVTSPGPTEGKTTTVANLAVVLGETGLSVLVVDCDFRRPSVRTYLGRDDERLPGADDPLRNVAFTAVDDDDLADDSPATILAAQRELIAGARSSYDVVILDTAPLLTTNDAAENLAGSDQVLLLARTGRTTKEAADLAGERLDRQASPPVTAALIGVTRATRSHVFGKGRRLTGQRRIDEPTTIEVLEGVGAPSIDAPASTRAGTAQAMAAARSAHRRRPTRRIADAPQASIVHQESSGTVFGLLAAILALVVVVLYASKFTDVEQPTVGALVLLPLVVGGAWLMIRRVRYIGGRDIGSIMLVGLMLRLVGSYIRYLVPVDATTYHDEGVRLASSFRNFDLHVDIGRDLIGTGFIRYLSGWVHVAVFDDMSAAFLVWVFFSFAGCVLLYKAFVLAIPHGDTHRYAMLIFLWPSLSYWPDSIGKEGWMLLGIGLASYGAARIFVGRWPTGLLYVAAGLTAAALVRPHVALAMFIGMSVGLLIRRSVRPGVGAILKAIGLVLLVVVGGFLANKTAAVLSHDETADASSASLGTTLNAATDRTSQGDSAFQATVVRTPLDVPKALVTVLFRPFPTEARDINGLMTAAESLMLVGLMALSYPRLLRLPKLMRDTPYVTYVVVYTSLFVYAFSSIGNFGILARQRTQLTPLLLVLIALPPVTDRLRGRRAGPATRGARPNEAVGGDPKVPIETAG